MQLGECCSGDVRQSADLGAGELLDHEPCEVARCAGAALLDGVVRPSALGAITEHGIVRTLHAIAFGLGDAKAGLSMADQAQE